MSDDVYLMRWLGWSKYSVPDLAEILDEDLSVAPASDGNGALSGLEELNQQAQQQMHDTDKAAFDAVSRLTEPTPYKPRRHIDPTSTPFSEGDQASQSSARNGSGSLVPVRPP